MQSSTKINRVQASVMQPRLPCLHRSSLSAEVALHCDQSIEPYCCLYAPFFPSSPQEGIQKREVGLANAAGMALLGGLCLYRGFRDAEE